MPLLFLRIYDKGCVQPQIFSKSIDIWLWNFAHLFTIMYPTCRQEEVTVLSILTELCPFSYLELTLEIAYHLKYFQSPSTYCFETAHLFNIMPRRTYSYQAFWQNYAPFWLRIYVKVCLTPQIFSKYIDIWLWNFAHLFTIMPKPVDRRR
jgi:hypothetical protein